MEDQNIIQLYRSRDEQAIAESERKYGAYCRTIAQNILGDPEDARECVSDVWLRAWNHIPEEAPRNLRAYFARLTRGIAVDRYRRTHSEKRGGGQLPLALEELDACLPAAQDVERQVGRQELARTLRRFLDTLSDTERSVFLCRYWYFDSVPEIALRFGFSRSKVTSMLHRTRNKLKPYLKEAGYTHEDL